MRSVQDRHIHSTYHEELFLFVRRLKARFVSRGGITDPLYGRDRVNIVSGHVGGHYGKPGTIGTD